MQVTKAKRVLEARRKSAARRSRLNRLITKATQWFDMLSSGSGGLEESNALPPPPPVNIVAVPLSSTTVQVKWEPPPHVSGPDRLSYKVRARNMSSKSVFGQFDAEGKSDKGSCVIIVKGLLPGIVYNLQVIAVILC